MSNKRPNKHKSFTMVKHTTEMPSVPMIKVLGQKLVFFFCFVCRLLKQKITKSNWSYASSGAELSYGMQMKWFCLKLARPERIVCWREATMTTTMDGIGDFMRIIVECIRLSNRWEKFKGTLHYQWVRLQTMMLIHWAHNRIAQQSNWDHIMQCVAQSKHHLFTSTHLVCCADGKPVNRRIFVWWLTSRVLLIFFFFWNQIKMTFRKPIVWKLPSKNVELWKFHFGFFVDWTVEFSPAFFYFSLSVQFFSLLRRWLLVITQSIFVTFRDEKPLGILISWDREWTVGGEAVEIRSCLIGFLELLDQFDWSGQFDWLDHIEFSGLFV